jgi:hypothetical protein
MEKQLSEFSIVELKALAYDQLVQLEVSQTNLRVINREISKRLQPQHIDPLPPVSIQSA